MDNLTNSSSMLQFTISKMTGDMNFVGMFYIIIGAIYSLSIIGAIIGIPLIISGLRLRESSDAFKLYVNANDTGVLERALERQGKFFFIQKVFVIITIVATILYIIAMIVIFGTLMTQFGGNGYYS